MRLLINVSSIGGQPTGMGVYAMHQARHLRQAFDCDIVAAEGVDAFGPAIVRAPASHALGAGRTAAVKRWAWARRQSRMPGRILYSPTHHSLRVADAQILTIHDLISVRFMRQHPLQHLYFRHVLPRELNRCAAVFTVSETSKQDIHDYYRYPLDRIRVVPNGVDTRLFRPAPGARRRPFLLVVGAAYAHKNVHELLRVAHLWRQRYQLVLTSCRGSYRKQLLKQVHKAGLSEQVRTIEYASPGELLHLYQSCSALVTASRWEGFGIPLLEAMACGARVIASDIPAHREVLAGHERLVQLGDEASWASAFDWLDQNAAGRSGQTDRSCQPGHPDQLNPLGRPGRPRSGTPVERYTWERSGQVLASHLLEVEPSLAHTLKTKWTQSVGSIA